VSVEAVSDALWALLGAGVLGTALATHRRGSRLARLSVLVRRLEAHGAAFVLVLLGWAWLGWHFFAR